MFTQTLHLIVAIIFFQPEEYTVTTNNNPTEFLTIETLIPSIEVLEKSIKAHHTQETQILIKEFRYKEKTNILAYIPTIGCNLTDLATTITYNSSKLLNSLNGQRSRKAKLSSIKEHMKISLQTELMKLYRHYADLKAEIDYYNTTRELFILNQTLFNIQIEQYNNLEITPTEFTKNKIKLKEEELRLMKKYTNILKLRNHILEIAKIITHKLPDEKDS